MTRMLVTLALLALVILVGAFVYLRRKPGRPAERPALARPAVPGATSAFHAVSIKLGPNPCESARNMADKRFLSGAAPRLPLPDCTNRECKCRFVHHKDRRESEDRRSPFGQGMTVNTGSFLKEQRQGADRRHDLDDDVQ